MGPISRRGRSGLAIATTRSSTSTARCARSRRRAAGLCTASASKVRSDRAGALAVVPEHVRPWFIRAPLEAGGVKATAPRRTRMKLHANARTCPNSRRLLVARVEAGWSVLEAAEAAGITDRTARRWLARWRAEGPAGLFDRSSAPRRI